MRTAKKEWFGRLLGVALVILALLPGTASAAGEIDNSFSYSGTLKGGRHDVADVLVQANDKMVVGLGYKGYNQADTVWAERLDTYGRVERTFTFAPVAGVLGAMPSRGPFPIALQGDDGSTDPRLITLASDAVMRWNPDGTLDNSFGVNGYARYTGLLGHPSGVMAPDLEVLPDGKILLLVQDGLLRFTENGWLDPDFGVGGILPLRNLYIGVYPNVWPIFGTGARIDSPITWRTLDVDTQGRIVVTGWDNTPRPDPFILLRLSPDGRQLDPTFGDSGIASAPISGAIVQVAPDDTIILLDDGSLSRIDQSGHFDTSFGVQGVADATVPNGYGGSFRPSAVAFDGTAANYWIYTSMGPLRFTKDGQRDGSFTTTKMYYSYLIALDHECRILGGSFSSLWRLNNSCVEGGNQEPPPPTDVVLSATASKKKGINYAALTWTDDAAFDVYRDGQVIASAVTGGNYTDNTGTKGSATFSYQVCKSGTDTCSNTAEVTF